MMARCTNCGHELEKEAGVCSQCGQKHPEKNTDQEKKEEPIFKDEDGDKLNDVKDPGSIAGFVLGLAGPIVWVIPLVGLSFAIVGMVLTNRGRKLPGNRHRMYASAGFFLNLIFFLFNIFMFTLVCMGEAPA